MNFERIRTESYVSPGPLAEKTGGVMGFRDDEFMDRLFFVFLFGVILELKDSADWTWD